MEHPMRNNILAVAAIAAAISAPIAVRAQTVGVAPGASVVVAPVLPAEQYPAFRQYVVRERMPDYAIRGRVVVGTVLPETGVTFYDVPSTIAATPYRYTIV